MLKKWQIFFVLTVVLAFQGCETIKGASEGFKKDWKDLKKIDSQMKRNLW